MKYLNTALIQLRTKAKSYWRIWAKALGEKSGNTDREADRVALIRTAIIVFYIITNAFIIAGVIKHWN